MSLAQNLDLEVVAEGIENKVQLNLVRDLGCQLGQGHLFAAPLSVGELEALIKAPPAATLPPQPKYKVSTLN